MKIRAEELVKKKQLMLKYLGIQKKQIQKEKEKFSMWW